MEMWAGTPKCHKPSQFYSFAACLSSPQPARFVAPKCGVVSPQTARSVSSKCPVRRPNLPGGTPAVAPNCLLGHFVEREDGVGVFNVRRPGTLERRCHYDGLASPQTSLGIDASLRPYPSAVWGDRHAIRPRGGFKNRRTVSPERSTCLSSSLGRRADVSPTDGLPGDWGTEIVVSR